MCCCNADAIKRIADAVTEMSEHIVYGSQVSYDGSAETDTFEDGSPVLYCPMTRRQCMGRLCAAAEREECAKLAAITTGHVVEWKCAEYGNVVDFDAAEQPTPEEAEEVRADTVANVAEILGERDVDIARVFYDLMGICRDLADPHARTDLYKLMAGIRHGDYDRADATASRDW